MSWKSAITCNRLHLSQTLYYSIKLFCNRSNLEKSHANERRLKNLILVIAIAYTCAVIQGQRLKLGGVHKYIGRLTECRRSERRPSSFWIGLYGQSWVIGMEFCQEIVAELRRARPNKVAFFHRGLRAMSLIQSGFWRGCHPARWQWTSINSRYWIS